MENDKKQYELRSRSRSRSETPQIGNRIVTENEGSEHQYDLRSRSRDRSMTPGEVTSSRRSSSRSLPSSVIKARNKAMDTITEQKDDTLTETNNTLETTQSKTTVSVTKSTKKSERRSERQRAKRQIFANGQTSSEVIDDSSDTKSETKDGRDKRESVTPKRVMTSDYSSEEGDREEIPSRPGSAFDFYKQQGEDYWNKFPKTDYTYSPASKCRYEVAPGIMAVPNMSRRSLHAECQGYYNDSESSKEGYFEENNMDRTEIRRGLADGVPQVLPHIRGSSTAGQSVVYQTTHVKQYTTRREYIYDSSNDNQINEKYESWVNPLINSNRNSRYRSTTNVDSDTEFDEAILSSNNRYQYKKTGFFSKFTSLVSTIIFTTLHLITFNQFKRKEVSATSHYYRRHEESRWSRMFGKINTSMQHLYLLLVKVVLLDSWLLSRASNMRERVQGRYAKIRWLVLLPLFLAAGLWMLPYILSAIPILANQVLQQSKQEEIPVVYNYATDNLKSNDELKNLVNILMTRVQQLETAKTEQSKHLANVTQYLEDLKRSDSDVWKHYDEKLVNLEQEMENQNNANEKCKTEELDFIRVEFQTLKNLYTQLKTCCDTATANIVSEDDIRKQADQVFAGYFGDSFSKEDVIRIFQVMNLKIQQEDLQNTNTGDGGGDDPNEGSNLAVDEIRKIVLGILKIYDADKTGRVDYALESAGGQVISTRCTQLYNIHTRAFKILGITVFYESNNPRTVIQGNTLQPGMCWAFQDFPGYLLVKLRSMIYVTGFSIEHAPRANLPNGEMKSAPKRFNVWGLRGENDLEPVMFGEYEFLDSNDSLQYFPVQNTSITWPHEFVELRIHSNHGQLEYTCLYRFRVHGNLA